MVVVDSTPGRRLGGSDITWHDRVALVAASTLDREELLRGLLAELSPLVGCQSLGFFWRSTDAGFSATVAASGGGFVGVESIDVGVEGWSQGDKAEAFCTVDNSFSSHPVLKWLGRQGFNASACVPVVVARNSTGWLVASRRESTPFGPEETRWLARLSPLVGPALFALQLHERLEVAHRELASAKDEITRSERLTVQVDLAYGVAHDLNNILGLISARADLLRRHLLPSQALSSVEAIRAAVDDGVTVIRRITQSARNQLAQELVQLDVNRLVEDALEMTRPRWQGRAVPSRVRMRFDPGKGAMVRGVPSELREVLVNLVGNALDAMPRGGELAISTRQEGGEVVISVSDTGCGMSEEVRQSIFQPFFTTKGGKGSGLGLWVSQGIVVRHGGEIQVHSRPGMGSTFSVRLPLPASTPGLSWDERAGGRRSILVVDDEVGLAEALRLCLEMAGHRVAVSADGRQALEAFGAHRFDLVITDLRMPGMSGWELAAEIKRLSPRTPIIAMTGWPVSLVNEGQRAADFDTIVQKPCRTNELQALVARLLGERTARTD